MVKIPTHSMCNTSNNIGGDSHRKDRQLGKLASLSGLVAAADLNTGRRNWRTCLALSFPERELAGRAERL